MAFNISPPKAITRQQDSSFLGPKIWTEISQDTKNVKTTAFLPMLWRDKLIQTVCVVK